MARKYRSTWTAKDFIKDNTILTAGKWVEIGEFIPSAGLYYTPGFGFSSSQSDADGRVFFNLQSATAEIKGALRLACYTPDEQPVPGGAIKWEARTEALNSVEADRTKQLPHPEMDFALGEDYRFKLMFKADANATIDAAKCKMLMDITMESKSI